MWHSGGPATDLELRNHHPRPVRRLPLPRALTPACTWAGWALCTTAVTGYIAGANAAKKALDGKGLA